MSRRRGLARLRHAAEALRYHGLDGASLADRDRARAARPRDRVTGPSGSSSRTRSPSRLFFDCGIVERLGASARRPARARFRSDARRPDAVGGARAGRRRASLDARGLCPARVAPPERRLAPRRPLARRADRLLSALIRAQPAARLPPRAHAPRPPELVSRLLARRAAAGLAAARPRDDALALRPRALRASARSVERLRRERPAIVLANVQMQSVVPFIVARAASRAAGRRLRRELGSHRRQGRDLAPDSTATSSRTIAMREDLVRYHGVDAGADRRHRLAADRRVPPPAATRGVRRARARLGLDPARPVVARDGQHADERAVRGAVRRAPGLLVGRERRGPRASRCSSARTRATATGASASRPALARAGAAVQEPSFTDLETLAMLLQHARRRRLERRDDPARRAGQRPAGGLRPLRRGRAGRASRWAQKNVIGEHYRDVAGVRRVLRGALVRRGRGGDRAVPARSGRACGRSGARSRARSSGRSTAAAPTASSRRSSTGSARDADAAACDRRDLPRGERYPRRAAPGARARGGLVDGVVGARPRRGPARRGTVGEGPGEKLPLLNRVLEQHGPVDGPVLLSDDDIEFVRGDVVELVALSERAGLGLAQPAHVAGLRGQPRHHARPPTLAVRLTTFVESGPLVVVAPGAVRAGDLPFPMARDGLGARARLDRSRASRSASSTPSASDISARSPAPTTTPRFARGCARSWRSAASTTGPRSSGRSPSGGRGSGVRRGGRRDLPASKRGRPAADASRRPLVLARGRPCRRGAPAVSGVSRVRPLAAHLPRAERRLADRARDVRPMRGTRVFPVPYSSFGAEDGDPRRALRGVPRDWDHVVHHPASTDPEQQRFEGLRRYYEAARRHFRGRAERGCHRRPAASLRAAPAAAPRPAEHETRERATRELGGRPTIAVMPAGSGARHLYPSLASWLSILDELERRIPDVGFAFVGRLGAAGGRTVSGIGREEVGRLLASPAGRSRRVRPSDPRAARHRRGRPALSSPHTGFGIAALAVGTPWLTLSGGDWHEYFFNGVPFHSVLPTRREHEVFTQGRPLPLVDAGLRRGGAAGVGGERSPASRRPRRDRRRGRARSSRDA